MADINLRYELWDTQGNIVAATHDYFVAEALEKLIGRVTIVDLNSSVTKVAWYKCDFSKYFLDKPVPEVTVCDTVYRQKNVELEVMS